MASLGQTTLIGDKALLRKLERLEDGMRGRALRGALEAGMRPIIADARRRAPRSSGAPTRGNKHLADSIDGEVVEATAHGAVGNISYGKKQFHGTILEVGGRNVLARPFLRPAFDSQKSEAQRAVAEEAWRLIRRLAL